MCCARRRCPRPARSSRRSWPTAAMSSSWTPGSTSRMSRSSATARMCSCGRTGRAPTPCSARCCVNSESRMRAACCGKSAAWPGISRVHVCMRMRSLIAALVLLAGGGVAAAAPAQPNLYYNLDPHSSGRCLDASDWGNGQLVQMWACHNFTNQQWYITGGDAPSLVNAASNQCVAGTGRGQQLRQAACADTDTQRFVIRLQPSGYPVFESKAFPGQCIDVADWGASTVVQLWDCSWGPYQQWRTA
ncbi:hypothetical protein D5S17_13475 [Pseudonocardiaceae bacterium YIM PH 21723]|nr:hypothetical protein D5S17_13475 [Pseudonocardiaceae bacterium YIM PH 21723]